MVTPPHYLLILLQQDWEDIDTPALGDIHQVALYVYDIFEYYKKREVRIICTSYMKKCYTVLKIFHEMRTPMINRNIGKNENRFASLIDFLVLEAIILENEHIFI